MLLFISRFVIMKSSCEGRVVMTFEQVEDNSNKYIRDPERGITMKKSGGGQGFTAYEISIGATSYDVHVEEIYEENSKKIRWETTHINPIPTDFIERRKVCNSIYDVIETYKNLIYARTKDSKYIKISDDLLKEVNPHAV